MTFDLGFSRAGNVDCMFLLLFIRDFLSTCNHIALLIMVLYFAVGNHSSALSWKSLIKSRSLKMAAVATNRTTFKQSKLVSSPIGRCSDPHLLS